MASGKLFRFPQFSFLLRGKVMLAIENSTFSLRPPSALRFSGNAAFALQDPLRGGGGCRETGGIQAPGERGSLGKFGK